MDPATVNQVAGAASQAVPGAQQIYLYAVILAAFIAIPTIADIFMAYYSQNKTWKLLIEKAGQDTLDKEELQTLIKATASGPPGIAGMSRALMALSVIIILGIAVFHLLAYGQQQENLTIINNVLSMLGATLAAITGFYFGGRSAEEKTKTAAPPLAKPPGTGAQTTPAEQGGGI
jgi:hypothetical protein